MRRFCRFVILFVIVLFLAECKKGENDPLFSTRTRKARLTGEWKMTSGKALYHDPGSNVAYVFDASSYTANVRIGNKVQYKKGDYGIMLNILGSGEFSLKEVYGPTTMNCSGEWNFNNGVGKQKQRIDAAFSIDNVKEGFTTEHLFNRTASNFIYVIKELRNKKLVINSLGRILSDTKGNYATFTTEYTFER